MRRLPSTTLPSEGMGDSGAGAYRLLVLHAPDSRAIGASYGLGSAITALGRMEAGAGSVVLEDAAASRQHARIERSGDHAHFFLRDLGSRNGTRLNGRPLEGDQELADGDLIRIGDHLLLFEYLTLVDCELLLEPADVESSLLGESAALARVRGEITRLAPTDEPLLVTGEPGVGKERVAAEIHRLSGRPGPFVPVNCAAIPEALAESELFGHVAGSFTGATRPHPGLFVAADGGTLFLDELAELTAPLQAKLLRAVATGEVRAVGETSPRRSTARVVAATNADLRGRVESSEFRADLLSRFSGFTLEIPPLRTRRADVLPLLAALEGLTAERIAADAAEALLVYGWPYNVRELLLTVRGALAGRGDHLELEHLPRPVRDAVRSSAPAGASVSTLPPALSVRRDAVPTAEELSAVLAHFGGNVVKAAAFFGRDRRQIYRWAERLGVALSHFRDTGSE